MLLRDGLTRMLADGVRRRDNPMDRLTPREQQVLKLMAEGLAILKYLGT